MKGGLNCIKEVMAIFLPLLLLHSMTKIKLCNCTALLVFIAPLPASTENGADIANIIVNCYYTYFCHQDYLQM